MRRLRPPYHDTGLLVVLTGLGGAAIVLATSLFDASLVQNDSAQYVSVAENLMAGHGMATSLVWTAEHHLMGGLPVAQTNVPPGYSVLIALVGELGVAPLYAALFVAVVCFSLIPLVLYRILRAAGQPTGRSLVASGVWFLLPVAWFNVLACLSETSYTLFTLLSLACVVRSQRDPDHDNAWLFLGGALAGLAFATRYAGIVYIASLGVVFALRAVRRRDAPSIGDVILVGAPAATFVLALFARNYRLTGRFAGGLRAEDGNSTAAVLQSLYWSLNEVTGFSKTGLLGGEPAEWLLVALAAGVLVCLAAGLRPTLNAAALRTLAADTPAWLSVVYVVGGLAVIVVAAANHASGVMSPRYLLPLIPFVLILLAKGVDVVGWAPRGRGQRTMVVGLRWGALAVFLAGQADVVAHQRGVLLQRPYRQIEDALQQPLGSVTLREFLRQRVSVGAPVLGNESQLTGAVLDRPAVGLPGQAYTHTLWTDEETRRVVAKYRVGYVLFFPQLFDQSAPEVANQIFFRDLAKGQMPPWLQPAFSSASVRLYRVRGPDA